MWQLIQTARAPSGKDVTSRHDMGIPVFFNRVQLLSDDLYKAEINIKRGRLYSVISNQLNLGKPSPPS